MIYNNNFVFSKEISLKDIENYLNSISSLNSEIVQKDQKLKQQFREESWANRYNLCQQFSDKRFSYFGLRLIYEECPEVLPSSVRDKIELSVTKQLTSQNKEKWKTCGDFDKEIEIIRNGSNTKVEDFAFELKNIRKYFEEIYN